MIIEPQYYRTGKFSEGLAPVMMGGELKKAEMTINGKKITPDEPYQLHPGKWGYIDKTGKVIIKPQFGVATHFSEGLAAVTTGDSFFGIYGYMDKAGKFSIKPIFEDAKPFSEGLALVLDADEVMWGYINKKGKYVIKPRFDDEVGSFSEGLARVWDDKWGYIDKKGKYVIKPQFEEASDFYKGLAKVSKQDDSGDMMETYIDKTGKIILSQKELKAENN